jgi:serine/threonine protein kinase
LNNPPSFPVAISGQAEDLINRLLTKDTRERLLESEQIKRHQFFNSIDWDQLERKQVKAPFVPQHIQGEYLRARGPVILEEPIYINLTSA